MTQIKLTELTPEQEDYLLEDARERYFEDKEREQEERPSIALSGFKRSGKCQFCNTEQATDTIEDSETLQEVNICKSCLILILKKYIDLNESQVNCCLNTNESEATKMGID